MVRGAPACRARSELSEREHEVVVLGAGPAGCAGATLLARGGHAVALVRPASTPAGELAESVPPSARKLLGDLGVLEAVARGGFQANLGNTVWWAGRPARSEPFGEGEPGFHVDRRGLEDVLVQAALAAGASVYDGFAARAASESSAGWAITCRSADGSAVEVRAPWVLDATGRRGFLARREGREPDPRTTTLALLGRWCARGGWKGVDSSHTLVESYQDGWAWSVPLTEEMRCFAAMVDPRNAELARAREADMMRSEMAKAEHLGPMLAAAEPAGDVWACSASLYASRRYARRGLLLVGDAASFIDPLSSFGVKKALSSGWLAGVVAHTALVDPPLERAAIDFYDAREREVYRSYRRLSAAYFEEAAEVYRHAYWRTRAEAARAAGGQSGEPDAALDPDLPEPAAVPEADVRAAFENIRSRERLEAVRGPTARTFRGPAIDGHRIVLEDHVASDAYPRGMRFVRGVDLRRLVEEAPRHHDVPDVWSAYNRGAAPVTLPDFLTALATAFAAGFLALRSG